MTMSHARLAITETELRAADASGDRDLEELVDLIRQSVRLLRRRLAEREETR